MFVLCLTVSEVKVKQMPPKPFRDRARKMRADRTEEQQKVKVLQGSELL